MSDAYACWQQGENHALIWALTGTAQLGHSQGFQTITHLHLIFSLPLFIRFPFFESFACPNFYADFKTVPILMSSNFFLIIHILTTARGCQQSFHHDFNKNHAFLPHSSTCLSELPFLSLFKMSLCCFHTAAGRQAQSTTQTSSGNPTCPLSLKPSCQQPVQALWCREMLENMWCWDLRALRDALKLT